MACGCGGKKKNRPKATQKGTTRQSQVNKLIPKEAKGG